MWQLYYVRAQELALERILEAERERLAQAVRPVSSGTNRVSQLRRRGALAAAAVARRLDECVARDALAVRPADERLKNVG
jgi:hypothetical protein